MERAVKRVLITDLDDTLWDWLQIWYASFQPMFQEVLRITGVPEDEMIAVIKSIHEKHGTSEYTFLLQDIERTYCRDSDFKTIKSKYESAMHAFRHGRKEAQQLFPGVAETLQRIKSNGAKIVGYTESLAYATTQRLKAFDLDGVLDVLYSPQDHDRPTNLDLEEIRSMDASHYALQKTVHHHTPPGELKPNPDILQAIIADLGARKEDCVYVGDKLVKDVKMARDAGVLDVWARYGSKIHTDEYALLRRVTHWKQSAVAKEATTIAVESSATSNQDEHVPVSITLDSFEGLLTHVRFEHFTE